MTTLVTGATGFVGSHVLRALLARGEAVRALVRDPGKAASLRERGAQVVVGDMRDPGSLRAAVQGVDVLHHCAAMVRAHHSRQEIFSNLEGARQLLEAVRQTAGARVVLLSGLNVLGLRNFDGVTEDLPCRRSHDPATDVKIAIEQLARDHVARHGLHVTVLRPGFIYGPGDTRNLPALIGAVRRGKFSYIGSRENVVPLVHVSDVVQAMLLAAEQPAADGRVYHITDGGRTTIGDLAGYLAELSHCAPPERVVPFFVAHAACVALDLWRRVRRSPRPPSITRAALFFVGTSRFVDIRRAVQELGYAPQVSYREGIAATVRWMEENANADANLAESTP